MKKKLSPRAIYTLLIAIILILSIGLGISLRELDNTKLLLEFHNRSVLSDMESFAFHMYLHVEEPDDIKRPQMPNYSLFLQRSASRLSNISPFELMEFLTKYEDRLMNALLQDGFTADTLTEEEIELGFQYYIQMREDLKNICSSVLRECQQDPKYSRALVTKDSEAAKELETRFQEYADKWTVIMKEFFKEESLITH